MRLVPAYRESFDRWRLSLGDYGGQDYAHRLLKTHLFVISN